MIKLCNITTNIVKIFESCKKKCYNKGVDSSPDIGRFIKSYSVQEKRPEFVG